MQAPRPKPRELVPAATHLAICYCVCDVGTHEITYPGKPPKNVHQLRLQWELPNCQREFDDNGEKVRKPMVISKEYTFSTYEGATLAQHVTPWMGACPDNFNFEDLIGQACYLSVVHKKSAKGSQYAAIAGVTMLPDGTQVPEQFNETIFYDMASMGRDLPESIQGDNYKWLREKIESSMEFQEPMVDSDNTPPIDDDDIPF
jgi:hypothetical protein